MTIENVSTTYIARHNARDMLQWHLTVPLDRVRLRITLNMAFITHLLLVTRLDERVRPATSRCLERIEHAFNLH